MSITTIPTLWSTSSMTFVRITPTEVLNMAHIVQLRLITLVPSGMSMSDVEKPEDLEVVAHIDMSDGDYHEIDAYDTAGAWFCQRWDLDPAAARQQMYDKIIAARKNPDNAFQPPSQVGNIPF